MTPRGWRTPPGLARKITAHAQANIPCGDCGAAPGEPCTEPGDGRAVHGRRWTVAAIAYKRQSRAAWRTPEQEAALAALPRVPSEEIEACRLPDGGYRFDRATLTRWGVPWPPPAGWRKAVERDEDDDTTEGTAS